RRALASCGRGTHCGPGRPAVITTALLLLTFVRPAADTLVVSPTGPYRSVGDAVAAAPAGATAVVRAGVYHDPTVEIDLQVLLDGEGERQILRVSADSVTVRGLTLRNVGRSFVEDRAAITVQDASWCTISDNRIEDAFFGIYLANAGWCVIERNTLVSGERRET